MTTQKKIKKTQKQPQGRPISTAPISQPAAQDASSLYALSSFSQGADLFAHVSLAVDKHRLRVFSTATGQAVADHILEAARVSSMIWNDLDPGGSGQSREMAEGPQPSKKKRVQQDSAIETVIKPGPTEVAILGLSDGIILCFSPSHGRILRTLSHPSSTSPILALATEVGEGQRLIWASGEDGALRLWDAHKNVILGSWKNDDRIPYSSLMIRPTCEEGRTDILAASHPILLLSKSGEPPDVVPKKLPQLACFTGHASLVKSTKWDPSKPVPTRFVSMAETDRFLYVWDISDASEINGKPVASVSLDSDARFFSLSAATGLLNHSVLLALSASGKITLYSLPHQFCPPGSSNRSPAKLPTLLPSSNIVSSTKKSFAPAHVVGASFIDGERTSIRVVRLAQGIRPVFTIVRYLDEAGQFIKNIQLEDIPDVVFEGTQPLLPNRRYMESSITVSSGVELGHAEDIDEAEVRDIDGDLRIDLAELSLGQRLAAMSDVDQRLMLDSEDEAPDPSEPKAAKKSKPELDMVPADSLTRTLIQALHSSDTRLIETCLAHSNPDLVRNTVRRLPSQLALPLLNACVERLGRGARAANMKGGGAGVSSQRGMTLVTWIRLVLAVHTGYLMTIPDLIPRLSGLHATLTARLALQESLLSLSGRLDMILSQIEMRSSFTPTPFPPKSGTVPPGKQEKSVKRYVEGESESSDMENEHMDVEVEIEDYEDSVEDVELGGDSREGSEDEQEDEEHGDETSDESELNNNEFIDDEAEEYSGDEESASDD